MPPLLTIAFLTLREATRRRVLSFLSAASLIAIGLSTWGFVKLNASATQPQTVLAVESVLVILLAFAFSVVLAIAAAFLAAPAIAGEVDSGVALALLPRPFSRAEYVLGKWLGLATLLVTFTFVVGGLEFVAIGIAAGYRPPHPLGALAYLSAEALALLTLALLASTRLPAIAGGIGAVAAFGASWIAGIVGGIAGALHNDGVQQGATTIGLVFPTDGLWRGAAFELQPVALMLAQESNESMRAQNPFATTQPPPGAFLAWTVCWMLALLAGAAYSFTRRDISGAPRESRTGRVMIHVVAVITAKPGQREAVLAAFKENVGAVHAEEGCLAYDAFVDAEGFGSFQAPIGPDTVMILERWASVDALKAHARAPHMAAYAAKTKDLVAGRAIHILTAA